MASKKKPIVEKKVKAKPVKVSHPMRKADKPMWQTACKSLRSSVSQPLMPRAIMDHEVKKPAGYTGI